MHCLSEVTFFVAALTKNQNCHLTSSRQGASAKLAAKQEFVHAGKRKECVGRVATVSFAPTIAIPT